MSVYDLVLNRRTCRKFEQQPVPREVLERLLEAGRLAPSGANLQPLEFVAVDAPALRDRIFPLTAWAGYLPDGTPREHERPTAWIVILHNHEVSADVGQDVGFAAESITLVAEDEGLASCCIGSLRGEPLAEVLGLPETHRVVLVIALGYRAEQAQAVEMTGVKYWRDERGVHYVPKRPRSRVTHWNGFGSPGA